MTDYRKDITEFVDMWPRGDHYIMVIALTMPIALNNFIYPHFKSLPLFIVFGVVIILIILSLPALFRKLLLPSQVTYNSLGLYVRRKDEESFYPWNCIQAGIQRYDTWGRRRVCSAVRTVEEEFYFHYGFGLTGKQSDIEKLSGFLKVLEESIPSQSIYRIDKRDSLKDDLLTTVIAAVVAWLLFFMLPFQDWLKLAIGVTVMGVIFWISLVIPRIKTIHRPLRASPLLAGYFLAIGILTLIVSVEENQNKLPKPQSDAVGQH